MNNYFSFLEIAKKDMEAARVLFSRKLYPHSIFYLEQAVEKGVKSFGLWVKILTEKECKDKELAGHDAWRIFSTLIERGIKRVENELNILQDKHPAIKQTTFLEKLQKQISELEHESKNIKEEIKDITKNVANIVYSDQKIQELINKINRFRGKLPRGLLKFSGEALRTYKEFYRLITLDLGKIKQLSPTDVKKIKDSSILFFKLLYSVTCLLYLSMLMSPHAVKSRYPDKNWNPLEEYNEKMPLVKRLKFFLNAAEEALDHLSEAYNKAASIEVVF